MPRVLISDKLSPAAVAIFRERGIEADVKTGLTPAELRAIIGEYDGLAVRSATKVTREVLEAAPRLKVVGRAGIGVDNVDVTSATARGAIAGSLSLHQGGQMGKEPLHGGGAFRQNPRPDRLRQYRWHCR